MFVTDLEPAVTDGDEAGDPSAATCGSIASSLNQEVVNLPEMPIDRVGPRLLSRAEDHECGRCDLPNQTGTAAGKADHRSGCIPPMAIICCEERSSEAWLRRLSDRSATARRWRVSHPPCRSWRRWAS